MRVFTNEFKDLIRLKWAKPIYRQWKLDRFWKKNQKEIRLKICHQWIVYQQLKHYCWKPEAAYKHDILHFIIYRELSLGSVDIFYRGINAIGVKVVP